MGTSGWILTQEKDCPEHYLSNPTEHDTSGIVDSINLGVASLEATDDVVGLHG